MTVKTTASAARNARSARARATPEKIRLWLRNEAGRKGVPQRRSFERWLAAIPELHARRRPSQVNILVVGSTAGQRFNREFRHRDHATNVLSFPCDAMHDGDDGLLGDLVICASVVLREAREQRKLPRDHFAHMTVHGVLHLLGHDHIADAEAVCMENLERVILATLGIPDPYLRHA